MNLRKISFGNFKCLYNTSFEPGKINVFIGANGSGKSTTLEAIGLLSAAMTDRVDSMSLQRRGVRLSVPSLYRSCFKKLNRRKSTVSLSVEWDNGNSSDIFRYDVDLIFPTDSDYWKYYSEVFYQNGRKIWDRNRTSHQQANSSIGLFSIDNSQNLVSGHSIIKPFSSYGIFQPNTMVLRGISSDPNQTAPIGLNGGRLPEAIKSLIHVGENGLLFGDSDMDDILAMID